MQTIKCSQVVSCYIKYIVPRTYILAFIFTYRSFPYLEVQATPTTCIPADRRSSPLFMVYTYYLISLFSYYSVMEIINKVPARSYYWGTIWLESVVKKPESAASLSPVRCDRPNTIHIEGAQYKASTEIKLYLITFIFITFRPSPQSPLYNHCFLHETGFLLSDRGTNFNMLKVS